jgi:toxin ParE1/3/4
LRSGKHVSKLADIKPRAQLDLYRHFLYIGQHNLSAADRLLAAFEEDVERLLQMPGMGRERHFQKPELRGLRSLPIKGFNNYLIFYKPTADGIEVLRVIHGARDIERALESDLP